MARFVWVALTPVILSGYFVSAPAYSLDSPARPSPYRGYYYKILKAQGTRTTSPTSSSRRRWTLA